MIRTIQDERINWFISFIMPSQELLSLKPIIAGGSMLSLYRAIKLHDTDVKWEALKRSLERSPKSAKLDPFGDIDIWFRDSNPIHSGDHQYSWLVEDSGLEGKSPFKIPKVGLPTKQGRPLYAGRINLNKGKRELFKEGPLGLQRFHKGSNWANSYRVVNHKNLTPLYSGEIQFIRKPVSSVNELLSSFDFINCSVAWHDGKLYYDDRIDDAFSEFELRINSTEPFERESIAMRVFGALRAFKYSARYNIDFSQRLSEYIFKLCVDSKDIDYKKYGDKVVEIETLYGKSISSVNTLKSMITHFQSLFDKFIKMKHFKGEYALYLVDCADSFKGLKDFVENETKKEQAKLDPEFLKAMNPFAGKQNIPF